MPLPILLSRPEIRKYRSTSISTSTGVKQQNRIKEVLVHHQGRRSRKRASKSGHEEQPGDENHTESLFRRSKVMKTNRRDTSGYHSTSRLRRLCSSWASPPRNELIRAPIAAQMRVGQSLNILRDAPASTTYRSRPYCGLPTNGEGYQGRKNPTKKSRHLAHILYVMCKDMDTAAYTTSGYERGEPQTLQREISQSVPFALYTRPMTKTLTAGNETFYPMLIAPVFSVHLY